MRFSIKRHTKRVCWQWVAKQLWPFSKYACFFTADSIIFLISTYIYKNTVSYLVCVFFCWGGGGVVELAEACNWLNLMPITQFSTCIFNFSAPTFHGVCLGKILIRLKSRPVACFDWEVSFEKNYFQYLSRFFFDCPFKLFTFSGKNNLLCTRC